MQKLRPLNLGKNKSVKKLTPFLIVAGLLMVFAVFLSIFSGSSSVVSHILTGSNLKTVGGRVNVLLLGIAGGMHDGANLTDTIMVVSYDLKSNEANIISIPRDLWLPAFAAKANAVYQIGLSQKNGLGFVKTVMGNVLGLPLSYALRVDFRGFVAAVDELDGVNIVVERTFDDYNYPIDGKENDLCGWEEKEMDFSEDQARQLNITPGKRKVFISPEGKIATDSAQEDKGAKYFFCRYEHIHFDRGLTSMDGELALKFVRSRHGTNGEASDFARSKRQEKVIEAVKNKVLSLETLINPQKAIELVKILGKSIDTDISAKEIPEFYKLFRKLTKVKSFVLDDSLLVHPPASDYGGAYVLISQDDDFSKVQEYVRKILKGEITEYDATASARTR